MKKLTMFIMGLVSVLNKIRNPFLKVYKNGMKSISRLWRKEEGFPILVYCCTETNNNKNNNIISDSARAGSFLFQKTSGFMKTNTMNQRLTLTIKNFFMKTLPGLFIFIPNTINEQKSFSPKQGLPPGRDKLCAV